MERSLAELSGLKPFRSLCLVCCGVAVCGLLLVSSITFAPSAIRIGLRAALFLSLVGLYFFIIACRTQVVISQRTRGAAETLDRPAPVWMTVLFSLAAVGAMVWPHFP